MKYTISYGIKLEEQGVLESLYEAILPDLRSLPGGCRGELFVENGYLVLRLECNNVSKLRALNNSFIGVLLLLLEVVGELKNGRKVSST